LIDIIFSLRFIIRQFFRIQITNSVLHVSSGPGVYPGVQGRKPCYLYHTDRHTQKWSWSLRCRTGIAVWRWCRFSNT
jgi:hypothetical protein